MRSAVFSCVAILGSPKFVSALTEPSDISFIIAVDCSFIFLPRPLYLITEISARSVFTNFSIFLKIFVSLEEEFELFLVVRKVKTDVKNFSRLQSPHLVLIKS